MYLKDLMQGEKYAFYSIVKHLVSIDGSFSTVEQNLVNDFLVEMNLVDEKLPDIEWNDAIDMLTFSSPDIKKKIFVELVGVTLCDEMLHANEEAFLNNIASKFLISEEEKLSMISIVRELLDIYQKMQLIVEN